MKTSSLSNQEIKEDVSQVRTYLHTKTTTAAEAVQNHADDLTKYSLTLRSENFRLLKQKIVEEQANRSKSEFLASMSHELRTPLNAIIGFSELMVYEMYGDLGDTRYQEYCKDIHGAGKHLLILINDILDIAKIESGKFKLDEEAVSIPEVIDSCMRLGKSRASNGKIILEKDIQDDLPYLYCDSTRLKQILLNLMTNGIKFTPKGGTVTIRASYRPALGFVLQVSDTGIGMTEEEIKIALRPFEQVESIYSRTTEGTGLGLPLAKSLVEMHHGVMEITSVPGKGTMVSLHFSETRAIKTESVKYSEDVNFGTERSKKEEIQCV